MRLLDRYIARQFLINVLVLFVILFGFVVTVDVSINLDRFSKAAAALEGMQSTEQGSLRHSAVTVLVIVDLWWPRLLQLFNFLLGMVMVGAMGFTCTQILRNREFLAMVSAGQSLHRVLRPVLLVALALSALQLVNQELIVPRIAPLLPRQHTDAGMRTLNVSNVPLLADPSGRLLYAREFDPKTETLTGVFVLRTTESGRAESAVRADSATWDGSGWTLEGATIETRKLDGVDPGPPPARIETVVSPTILQMNQYKGYREALSFRQIGRLLEREDVLDAEAVNEYQRLRWGRFSVVVTNLLCLVIAAPFFVSRLPTGILMRTITAAPVLMTGLMGGVLGASAEIQGMPAVLGVFVPPLVLLPISIAAFGAVKT